MSAARFPGVAAVHSAGGPLDSSDIQDAVAAALSLEHAVVWSYGLATAYLPPEAVGVALPAGEAHRVRRDGLEDAHQRSGVPPIPAAPSYQPPFPVTDGPSAGRLLAEAEDDTAAAWRAVLERTDDPDLRRLGTDAVVMAGRVGVAYRRAAGRTPVVDPFPGGAND